MDTIKLIDEYDKLWVAVMAETASSVSSEDMQTAFEAWNSDTEPTHKDSEQAQDIFQAPVNDSLDGILRGIRDVSYLPRASGGSHTGMPQGNSLLDESLMDDVIHKKGSKLFTWLNFNWANACMPCGLTVITIRK